MQYKQSTKIIIDKRKLDLLIRLNCPSESILSVITTGKFIKTNDSLIDETLECLIDLKYFENWGGRREGAGRPHKNHLENQVENHLDNQVGNQEHIQVADKDIDKDKDNNINNNNNNNNIITNNIKKLNNTHIKKLNTEIENIINNINNYKIKEKIIEWVEYKKERKESYTPIGLKKCIAKLERLSNNNPDLAMRIVDESISNNWSGLFPLKNNKTKAQTTDERNWEIIKNTFGLEEK